MAVVLGTGQQILDLLDKGLSALRIGPLSSFLAFFHDNPRRCRAARRVSRQQVRPEPLAHPADQTPQGPARRRIGSGYGWGRSRALGGTDCFARRLRSPGKDPMTV